MSHGHKQHITRRKSNYYPATFRSLILNYMNRAASVIAAIKNHINSVFEKVLVHYHQERAVRQSQVIFYFLNSEIYRVK